MLYFKIRQCLFALICFSLLASISACGGTTNTSVVRHSDGPAISSASPPTPSSTPISLDQQSVYIASANGKVSALNASSGSIRWSYRSQGKLNLLSGPHNGDLATPITFSNDVLYIASSIGIEAVNTTDGSLLWQATIGGVLAVPIVNDGVIYTDGGEKLFALSAKDGKVLWSQTMSSPSFVSGAVAVSDGIVYASTASAQSNGISAFQATNGKLLWQQNLTPQFWAVANGILYLTDPRGGGIFALNGQNGSSLWKSSTQTLFGFASNVVYTFGGDYYIYALNATDGSVIWQSKDSFFWHATPDLTNGIIYAATSGNSVAALNPANGSLLWTSSAFKGNIYLTGKGGEGPFVFYEQNNQYTAGTVAALNSNDGSVKWNTSVGYTTEILAFAGGNDGAVCLTSNDMGTDNSIFLFNTTNGLLLWHYASAGQFSGAVLG